MHRLLWELGERQETLLATIQWSMRLQVSAHFFSLLRHPSFSTRRHNDSNHTLTLHVRPMELEIYFYRDACCWQDATGQRSASL